MLKSRAYFVSEPLTS